MLAHTVAGDRLSFHLGSAASRINVEVSGLRGFSRKSVRLKGYTSFWRKMTHGYSHLTLSGRKRRPDNVHTT